MDGPPHVGDTLRTPAGRARNALDLAPMVHHNQDPRSPVHTVSVVLADPAGDPADLIRPDHLLPLRGCANGVVARPEHAEAGVDLCRLAGAPTSGVDFAESASMIAGEGGVLVYLRRPGAQVLGALDRHTWTADDGAAGAILADLGYRSVRLLTGPTTAVQLARPDLTVVASNFG